MRGFSTLELMVAMVIMMMTFTAVILTTFGNQSLILGGQTNAEAMNKAQELLETQQALARRDFNLVNATSSIKDDIYTKSITVSLLPDLLTKQVSAVIDWKDEHLSDKHLTLTTLISNFENVAGGSTCNSSPEGDWRAPTNTAYTIPALTGFSGGYPVTDLDVYRNILYATAGPTAGFSDKTFFAFTLSSAGVPTYISGSGLDTTGGGSTKGATAIQVVATTTTGRTYAFLGNGAHANWNTCALDLSCAQIEVVDVTAPASPNIVAKFKFATSSQSIPYSAPPFVNGSAGQGIVQSMFYKNGYLLVGLTKTASGPEFIIMDVHDPLSPLPLGYYSVGATVEDIYMRNNFVYLATDDPTRTLLILDVANPVTPVVKWADTFSSSMGKGNSFAAVGDTLYFSRDYDTSKPEFYVMNNADVRTDKPTVTVSAEIGQSVPKIYIRDFLAYLVSGSLLQLRSATSTAAYAPSIVLSGNGTAIDCENNKVFVSTDAGEIRIITAN